MTEPIEDIMENIHAAEASDHEFDQVLLVKKLARIAGEMDYVQKTGFNESQRYKFAREGDFKAKLKPLLAREEIWMSVQNDLVGEPILLGESAKGNKQWLTIVKVTACFRYRSAGVISTAIGQGVDPGDKGVYKAMTGGLKYIIATSFQVETGDDPEQDNELDGPAPKNAAPAPPAPSQSATQAPPAPPRPPDASRFKDGPPPNFTPEEFLNKLEEQTRRLGMDSVLWVAEKKFNHQGGPAMLPADMQRRFISYLSKMTPKG